MTQIPTLASGDPDRREDDRESEQDLLADRAPSLLCASTCSCAHQWRKGSERLALPSHTRARACRIRRGRRRLRARPPGAAGSGRARAAPTPRRRRAVPPGRRGPWISIRTPSWVTSAISICRRLEPAQRLARLVQVGSGRHPDRSPSGRGEVPGRAVDDDAGDHELVRHDHEPAVAGVDEGVREGEVVDAAGLVFDRDLVADADRL